MNDEEQFHQLNDSLAALHDECRQDYLEAKAAGVHQRMTELAKRQLGFQEVSE